MLSRLGNPLWIHEDDGQQQGQQQQQQHVPPPSMGQLGMLPAQAQGQQGPNLLSLTSASGSVLTGFRTPGMLDDDDWYFNTVAANAGADAGSQGSLFLAPPTQTGGSVTGAGSQIFSPFNMGGSGPFDLQGFDLGLSSGGGGGGDLASIPGVGNTSNTSSLPPIPGTNTGLLASFGGFSTAPAQMSDFGGGLGGFDVFNNGAGGSSSAPPPPPPASVSLTAPFAARGKAAVLRPLEIFPPLGAQPTLFQKRALRRNTGEEDDEKKRKAGAAVAMGGASSGGGGGGDNAFLDDVDDDGLSLDASVLNYDTDDTKDIEESGGKKDGKDSNANNSTVTAGDGKGKRKGMPAKNLMAERRRRKKLNDRLYMLRSVVPKISKMDRASILGDAIEYLKELLQKINDLQNELESPPPASAASLPPTPTSFHPLTPTLPSLPARVKEELCPGGGAMPAGPAAAAAAPPQQPSVEVRVREGRSVNIHMFCARRPGILLSAMRAVEGLGLDVQQAVISCFNGFSLDVFKAELYKEGPGILPDEIKAVLLQAAGFRGQLV